MGEGRARLREQYLQQLTDDDLALLAQDAAELARTERPAEIIRAQPDLIEDLLDRPSSFERVFSSIDEGAAVHFASPFLLFALAVHRTKNELANASYVTEWFGPRERMPIFDVSGPREFLDSGERRLFLAQLLASYTHVASGSIAVATRRGLRRQRYSELDPIQLANIVDAVPENERGQIYRRLGDLALFLTGVFPDHTATRGLREIDQGRLLRAAGIRAVQWTAHTTIPPQVGHSGGVGLLEYLGPRWYQMASDLEPFAPPTTTDLLCDLARRFGDARRVLNVLTDGFLFPWRSRWFGIEGS